MCVYSMHVVLCKDCVNKALIRLLWVDGWMELGIVLVIHQHAHTHTHSIEMDLICFF